MYYITCKLCGAHLDPGERCDCEKIAAEAATPTAGEKNRQKNKYQDDYIIRKVRLQDGKN